MKIYLAGPCDTDHRIIMIKIAEWLREHNYKTYCPWELKIENAWDYPQEEWAQKVFEADVAAIKDCDYMISINFGRISSAGTAWEQGYAMGINKPVAVLQVDVNNTSLMTYCGCTLFENVPLSIELFNELMWVTDHMPMEYHPKCKTILT